MRKIRREDYYKSDYESFYASEMSRCFNDLKITKQLLKTILRQKNDGESDLQISYSLYIMKMYLSHLREAIRLIIKINERDELKNVFFNNEISIKFKSIFPDIDSKNPNSILEKYLEIRHDVFHYEYHNSKKQRAFEKANNYLTNNGAEWVFIKENKGKYYGEVSVDLLVITKYFDIGDIPSEIHSLHSKIFKIIQLMLDNYVKYRSK